MATVLQEGRYAGEFLISEGEFQISRDNITIAATSGVIKPGTVLGKITASGKYKPSPDTGADGSQTAVAIALYGCDATSVDQKIAAITRLAEVNGTILTYDATVSDATKKAAKATQLAGITGGAIIVR